MQQAADVIPYDFQVGGHSKADGLPASLKDSQGRFLKKLQAGERGQRELAFYQAVEAARHTPAAGAAAASNDGITQHQATTAAAAAPDAYVMQQLAQWVPCSYGTAHVSGVAYLVLDDAAAGYSQPCILDIKVGFRTWYSWASAALQEKYRAKDNSTTQASCGFRMCGCLVQSCNGSEVWRADRHWGKQLTADNVQQALTRFADNGCLSLAELAQGPCMLLEQLQCLAAVFERQQAWHFFSASVLIVYEGAARTAAEARPCVRLIDFAHTFPTQQHRQQQQQQQLEGQESRDSVPAGIDANFLSGLNSLIATIQRAVSQM